MWLIWEQSQSNQCALNLANVTRIQVDFDQRSIWFYVNTEDPEQVGELLLVEILEFSSGEEAVEVYTKILQEISDGSKVFELNFKEQ